MKAREHMPERKLASRIRATLAVAVGLAIFGGWLVLISAEGPDAEAPSASRQQGDKAVTAVSLDYPTYPTERDLRAAADLVLIGTVMSDSEALNTKPIPHVQNQVRVDRVVKGSVSKRSIQVVLTGGKTDQGEFVVEGLAQPVRGNRYLMYLRLGTDGKYYPLAGGHALAKAKGAQAFEIPQEVTGKSALSVSPD